MTPDESLTDDVADQTPEAADGDGDSPWGTLIFGILFMIGGVWIYWYFGKLETEGGEVRMPAIAWALYEMVGRTGLMAIAVLLGALMTWSGVSDLRKRSE